MDNSMQMNMMGGAVIWCTIGFLVLLASSIIQTVVQLKILKEIRTKKK